MVEQDSSILNTCKFGSFLILVEDSKNTAQTLQISNKYKEKLDDCFYMT